MKREKKTAALIVLFLLSALISYNAAYLIAERYFFDKLFYAKSRAHGYLTKEIKDIKDLADFGDRGIDLVEQRSAKQDIRQNRTNNASKILGATNQGARDGIYKVAIIGDSIVWGTGVRFKNTVSQFLERKLNGLRKTKVFAIAQPGDSALDYLANYHLLETNEDINLYIFIVWENDVLLEPDYLERNDQEVYYKVLSLCSKRYLNEKVVTSPRYNDALEYGENDRLWTEAYLASKKNKRNLCIFKESVKRLPKNAIYLESNACCNTRELYAPYLRNNLIPLSDIMSFKTSKEYSWVDDIDKYFAVSKMEEHPSKMIHELYAEIAFQMISQNPKYGFIKR